jgi:hypothetical protein
MNILLKKWIKIPRYMTPQILQKGKDISKLTPKRINDKNGHQRKVYVKLKIAAKDEDDRMMAKDDLDKTRARIKQKLVTMAVPMGKQELSRAEYNKLFPEGVVKTPLGTVKLGAHQYEKLEERGRKGLLGAMFQTLSDPIVVLTEERTGSEAKIYLKSFKEPGEGKIEGVISVVVDINGQAIAISTGKRREKQI